MKALSLSFQAAVLAVLIWGLSACGGAPSLTGTRWILSELGALPLAPASEVTMEFGSDGYIGSGAGCNVYSARYEQVAGRLYFTEIQSTQMACEESAMQVESAFFEGLAQTRSFRLSEDRLQLMDASGAVLMVLLPQ